MPTRRSHRASRLPALRDEGVGHLVVQGLAAAVPQRPEQIDEIARLVKAAGGQVLRGGAFKPRTGPYSFQGVGVEGLVMMAEAGKKHGLLTITEVMTPEYVDVCAEYADILQVGTRNMQNFDLLRKLGECGKPVLPKRGFLSDAGREHCGAIEVASIGVPPQVLVRIGIESPPDLFARQSWLSLAPGA